MYVFYFPYFDHDAFTHHALHVGLLVAPPETVSMTEAVWL